MTGQEARAGVDDVVLGSVDDDAVLGLVLGLLDRLDELKAEADKWQRAALTLQGDRDALAAKVEALSGDAARVLDVPVEPVLRRRWHWWLWVVLFAALTGYNVAVGEADDAALCAFMGGLWVATLLWCER